MYWMVNNKANGQTRNCVCEDSIPATAVSFALITSGFSLKEASQQAG